MREIFRAVEALEESRKILEPYQANLDPVVERALQDIPQSQAKLLDAAKTVVFIDCTGPNALTCNEYNALKSGQIIKTVRSIQARTGLGLKEAKALMDRHR